MASELRAYLQARLADGVTCVDDLNIDQYAVAIGLWCRENKPDLQSSLAELARVHLTDRVTEHFIASGEHKMTRLNADYTIMALLLPWLRAQLDTEFALAKFLANHPPEVAPCTP